MATIGKANVFNQLSIAAQIIEVSINIDSTSEDEENHLYLIVSGALRATSYQPVEVKGDPYTKNLHYIYLKMISLAPSIHSKKSNCRNHMSRPSPRRS